MKRIFAAIVILSCSATAKGQKQNDATAPLHALQPDYPVPYTVPTTQNVKTVLDRVFTYVDGVTPAKFWNRKTNEELLQVSNPDTNVVFKPGDFRLTSYEWGVTYAGMTRVHEVTKDQRYADYTGSRMKFIASAVPAFRQLYEQTPKFTNP